MKTSASNSSNGQAPTDSVSSQQRQRALSRWENEGGASAWMIEPSLHLPAESVETIPLTNAELVQLHIRVIALESLVTTLLSEATDRQLILAREMASYILPRPGATQHPTTIRAAAQMLRLVEQAHHFRESATS